MSRATMYREPLETYLLSKIQTYLPLVVKRVEVQRLAEPVYGCNWDLKVIEPSLPTDMIRIIDRNVVTPLKSTIELVD